MRLFIAIFMFFIAVSLQAKEQKLSPIPPASVEYINLEVDFCDEGCLGELLAEDMLASFMARFEPQRIKNELLLAKFGELGGRLKPNVAQGLNQIAVIIPQKTIKSYANIVTSALISYISYADAKVNLKFIMSGDESEISLATAIKTAREQDIKYFIAPFTPLGANVLSRLINNDEIAVIPTLHSSNFAQAKENIIFGGVDYRSQILELLKFSNDKLAAFSDGSALGNMLNQYVRQSSEGEIFSAEISGKEPDLQPYLKRASKLNNGTFVLNLPLLKVSLIASQLRTYKISPFVLLSTQINYVPQLFNVISPRDRQNLLVASSITISNDEITGCTELFGLDLRYSWVGYSTAVALDYIYTNFIDTARSRLFDEEINGTQIEYKIKIFEAKDKKFTQLER